MRASVEPPPKCALPQDFFELRPQRNRVLAKPSHCSRSMLLVKSLGAKMSKAVLHKVMRGARRWQLRRGTELDPAGFNRKAGVRVRMTGSMTTRSPIRRKRRLVVRPYPKTG
ncbi:hypothetical protein X767_14865 [Mesorhizobium sp. LSJC264A00]|nr:hypothetical protein X767_14865 [Mesorhizobium sp. LSJC264A00]